MYGHKYEVWHVAPSRTNASLLATCYSDATGAQAAAMWQWTMLHLSGGGAGPHAPSLFRR